jgi:hypothetical protein
LRIFPEFVFVYDVTSYPPRQIQALPVPNSFCGMAWNPSGDEFYVSGGVDDALYIFNRRGLAYSRAAAVHLGHKTGIGLLSNAPGPLISEAPRPMVAGIGVNRSGTVAVVANFYNDSRTRSLFSTAVAPMTEIFDLNQHTWTYRSLVPEILRSSELPLPPTSPLNSLPRTRGVLAYAKDKHDAAYWQKKLGDLDYDVEDKLDTPRFNRELWRGMMGKRSYPKSRSGQDLRRNREVLLAP